MTLMNPILFFTVICITIIQIVLISIIRRGITLDTQLYQGEQSKLQSDLVDLIANLVSIKCMGIVLHRMQTIFTLSKMER